MEVLHHSGRGVNALKEATMHRSSRTCCYNQLNLHTLVYLQCKLHVHVHVHVQIPVFSGFQGR